MLNRMGEIYSQASEVVVVLSETCSSMAGTDQAVGSGGLGIAIESLHAMAG